MAQPLQLQSRSAPARAVAVVLAAAAGLHLAAFPEHLEQGLAVAGFFLVTAAAQLAAAALVQRGVGRRGAVLIAAGNLTLVALWAVSRTVALPGVGHGGAAEAATWLDVLAVVAEAVVAVALLARPSSAKLSAAAVSWPATGAVALVAVVVCVAALQWAPPTHAHDVPHSSPAVAEAVRVREPVLPHHHGSHSHGPAR
jgi:hypothetical protein